MIEAGRSELGPTRVVLALTASAFLVGIEAAPVIIGFDREAFGVVLIVAAYTGLCALVLAAPVWGLLHLLGRTGIQWAIVVGIGTALLSYVPVHVLGAPFPDIEIDPITGEIFTREPEIDVVRALAYFPGLSIPPSVVAWWIAYGSRGKSLWG
jgi:hypothetical protein